MTVNTLTAACVAALLVACTSHDAPAEPRLNRVQEVVELLHDAQDVDLGQVGLGEHQSGVVHVDLVHVRPGVV